MAKEREAWDAKNKEGFLPSGRLPVRMRSGGSGGGGVFPVDRVVEAGKVGVFGQLASWLRSSGVTIDGIARVELAFDRFNFVWLEFTDGEITGIRFQYSVSETATSERTTENFQVRVNSGRIVYDEESAEKAAACWLTLCNQRLTRPATIKGVAAVWKRGLVSGYRELGDSVTATVPRELREKLAVLGVAAAGNREKQSAAVSREVAFTTVAEVVLALGKIVGVEIREMAGRYVVVKDGVVTGVEVRVFAIAEDGKSLEVGWAGGKKGELITIKLKAGKVLSLGEMTIIDSFGGSYRFTPAERRGEWGGRLKVDGRQQVKISTQGDDYCLDIPNGFSETNEFSWNLSANAGISGPEIKQTSGGKTITNFETYTGERLVQIKRLPERRGYSIGIGENEKIIRTITVPFQSGRSIGFTDLVSRALTAPGLFLESFGLQTEYSAAQLIGFYQEALAELPGVRVERYEVTDGNVDRAVLNGDLCFALHCGDKVVSLDGPRACQHFIGVDQRVEFLGGKDESPRLVVVDVEGRKVDEVWMLTRGGGVDRGFCLKDGKVTEARFGKHYGGVFEGVVIANVDRNSLQIVYGRHTGRLQWDGGSWTVTGVKEPEVEGGIALFDMGQLCFSITREVGGTRVEVTPKGWQSGIPAEGLNFTVPDNGFTVEGVVDEFFQ